MDFDINNPLVGLDSINIPIFDAHSHIWSAEDFKFLDRWYKTYGVKKIFGIASPEIKNKLEEANYSTKIAFAYYLPTKAFADISPRDLLESVDEAHNLGYPMVKMWFGPRFMDYYKSQKPFRIDYEDFSPVFSRIEEYDLILDIHIADPDTWYQTKYLDIDRYRTKNQAIDEFTNVLEKYRSIRTIGVHFACLPEHLNQLSEILDRFPNLSIDTASTRWMVRELGKTRDKSRDFIIKYKKRILFATDLSVGWQEHPDDYFAGRLWAQRIFWETNVQSIKLPFPDDDSPNNTTYINGLKLPQDVLKQLYWKNAENMLE